MRYRTGRWHGDINVAFAAKDTVLTILRWQEKQPIISEDARAIFARVVFAQESDFTIASTRKVTCRILNQVFVNEEWRYRKVVTFESSSSSNCVPSFIVWHEICIPVTGRSQALPPLLAQP